MIYNFYRIIRFVLNKVSKFATKLISLSLFKVNKIHFKNGFQSIGIPFVSVQGTFKVGKNFKINNTVYSNPIGRNHKCIFVVRKNAQLIIGSNVGMSGTTIVCHKGITIGNNVKIGGNVCIYDTDFHSQDLIMRRNPQDDMEKTIQEEITIADDVFVGAHTSILKGVSVGKNSIIGACSVVTKNIPANEIWGGNPARLIRKINRKTND
jgi:acetyltransferase-like isoleucine patch superfamily enzyme